MFSEAFSRPHVAILVSFVLAVSGSVACISTIDSAIVKASSIPPANLADSAGVGKWQSAYDATLKDVITVNPDGTFIQELYQGPVMQYRSDVGTWLVDRSSSGCAYLHLQGAKDFAEGIDKANELFLGTDGTRFEPCQLHDVSLTGQLILTIVENRNYPQGVWLLLPTADLDAGFEVYIPVSTGPTPTP